MIWVHIILSVVSILAGLAAFITFMIFQNYQASVWGFAMGMTACILFRIHWLKYKNKINDYYSAPDLESISLLGFYIFAFGVSGFIYNIITFLVLRPPILPIAHSTILSAIWCFLTFKTGALLFWKARKYADFLHGDRLIEEGEPSTE